MASEYPAFVRALPEADLPFAGLSGRLFQGESGQAIFLETDKAVTVPEHSHGDQWGIVVAGSFELTLGGKTTTLSSGDSYFVPAGSPHSARLFPGFRAIDFFADRNRYRPRPRPAGG